MIFHPLLECRLEALLFLRKKKLGKLIRDKPDLVKKASIAVTSTRRNTSQLTDKEKKAVFLIKNTLKIMKEAPVEIHRLEKELKETEEVLANTSGYEKKISKATYEGLLQHEKNTREQLTRLRDKFQQIKDNFSLIQSMLPE